MSVRKIIAFFLALSLCFSLAACGGDPGSYETTEATEAPTTLPEETYPPLPALDMTGTNVIDGQAEFTFVRAYHNTTVVPPNPENKGTSFTANDGEYYLVLHLNVTNISSETKDIDDLFKVYLYNDDFGSGTMFAVVEPEGHRLDRSYDLAPNESALVYFMVRCPDSVDLTKMTIEIASETNGYLGEADFSTEFSYKEEAPKFAKGDVFTVEYEGDVIANKPGTTFTVTVQDVYASETLYPPNPTGNYTYWPDQADSKFVIVKLSVKNIGAADLAYYNIAGAHCLYNGTEKIEAGLIAEENGGQDMNNGGWGMTIAPNEENIVYFVMVVPNEQLSGPLQIVMYLEQQMYTYDFSA